MAYHFIIGIEGYMLNGDDIRRISDPHTVGVILFKRNFKHSEQLKALTASIKSVDKDLMICADQEGGRIQRFATDKFHRLNPPFSLQQVDEQTIEQYVTTLAQELKVHGIDFSLTPVVDLYSAKSRVINTRAFAESPDEVIRIAQRYINKLRNLHMPSVLKHFPGHGLIEADSHIETAINSATLNTLESTELKPFLQLIKHHYADSIMMAHVLYRHIDPQIASMSYFWMTRYLRQKCDFTGIIFSDDLGMFAATNQAHDQISAAKQFFTAGGDIALLGNDFEIIDTLLQSDTTNETQNHGFEGRWQRFKSRIGEACHP